MFTTTIRCYTFLKNGKRMKAMSNLSVSQFEEKHKCYVEEFESAQYWFI